ncbi:MAG: hypothetical protein AABW86_02605 [Candidatus Micrarchaeota archaeon]
MMILNMNLAGLPEDVVNELVHRGIASNKSEAIRLMILHYNEHYGIKPINQLKNEDDEEKAWQMVSEQSLSEALDNSKDQEAAKWYEEQFKRGAYDELNKSKKK